MSVRTNKKRNPGDQTNIQRAMLIAAAGAVTVLVHSESASAQTGDPIAFCRDNTASDSDRIACLEAAITELTGGSAKTAQTEAAPPVEAEATADLGAEQVARRKQPEPASARIAEVENDAETPTGLGAEQVAVRQERDKPASDKAPKEELEAKVVDFAYSAGGDLIVFLDNGNIWRQSGTAQGDVRLYKSRKYTVTIKKGLLSGYRMRIKETKKSFQVERIK